MRIGNERDKTSIGTCSAGKAIFPRILDPGTKGQCVDRATKAIR
jgi:hypothetical protein